MTAGRSFPRTADEAIARLKEGNERFVGGHARFPTVQKEVLAELAKGQEPYATILGCSDSRVPPELVFDAGFGELFVVRVAGNVLGPLHPGHAAIRGHASAYAALRRPGPRGLRGGAGGDPGEVPRCYAQEPYRDSAREHPARTRRARRTATARTLAHAAVEANVRHTVSQLLQTPEAQARRTSGDVKLIGAVYELESGRVRFLE